MNSSLTLWQRLSLKITLYAIPTFVVPRACLQYLVYRFFKLRCPSQVDLIRNHVIRWLGSSLDFEQFRLATAEKEGMNTTLNERPILLRRGGEIIEVKESNFKASWIPQISGADYIIFYIHGGGFTSGSSAANANYLLQIWTELQDRGISSSILSVEYDLSPEAQYPTALRQISAAYAYTCTKGKPVILVGDSAGAHLCLSLLTHIHSPHPKIELLENPMPPRLLVLVSPWVDLKNTGTSVSQNMLFDCLDKKTLDCWASQYLGALNQLDDYTDPLSSKYLWRDVLPKSTLMIAGEFECFVSDIVDLAQNIEEDQYFGLDICIEPLKCHAWPCIDFAFGIPKDSNEMASETLEMAQAMKGIRLQVEWIVKALAAR